MNILMHRKESGITQDQLAQKMGVDRSTVTKWETGVSFPRANLLPKLAQTLGCSVDELLRQDVKQTDHN